jgi:hypothetical protein
VYIPREEEPPESNSSDLECYGSLSWNRVKPGATVTGSFLVRNIGDKSSLLNWKIDTSSVMWGECVYTPTSGVNLSVVDGQVTVQVSVIAPDGKNSDFEGFQRVENKGNSNDFEGFIRVENIDNPNDFEEIPIRLTTPRSTQFLELLFQRFPHVFPILRHMMGY